MIMIDSIAERYGLLPSEVLARATTLDLHITDAAMSYRTYQQRRAQGEAAEEYTTAELTAMMENFRGN